MYVPQPIDTSNIQLPESITNLTELLAASTHDVWALGKLKNQITDHPDLVPYDELTEEKKDYDRNTAMETLKAIYALGYRIVPINHDGAKAAEDAWFRYARRFKPDTPNNEYANRRRDFESGYRAANEARAELFG